MDKYSTLDTIVRQLLLEMNEPTERRYPLLLAYGYSFLNGEYPVGAGGGNPLKTTLLEVGFDRSADLPSDYIEFVSVGRVAGQHVRALAYNARLAPAGLLQTPPAAGYGSLLAAPAASWPSYTCLGWETLGLTGWDGCCYGWGEWAEEFAIDREQGTLRLSSALAGSEGGPLLLHYHSSDQTPGAPTPIHPYWQQALKYWMLWQWYYKAKENFSAAREAKAEYYAERKKALRRTDTTTFDDLVTIINQNYNSVR